MGAAPHFERALLEVGRGAYSSAEDALRRSIFLAPDFADAHYHLGLLLARRGNFEAARRSFQNAVSAIQRAGETLDDEPPWLPLVKTELELFDRVRTV